MSSRGLVKFIGKLGGGLVGFWGFSDVRMGAGQLWRWVAWEAFGVLWKAQLGSGRRKRNPRRSSLRKTKAIV